MKFIRVETDYRGNIVVYDPENNDWYVSKERDKRFSSLKAAAGYIDRRIAAMKRVQPFSCVVGEEDFWRKIHRFSKKEVIEIVNEQDVWLKSQNSREKLKTENAKLYEDCEKNWEVIKKIETLEERIDSLRKDRDSLVQSLTPIDLKAIIEQRDKEEIHAD